MKNKILLQLSLKNIKANKILHIPFVLSTGLMLSLFYIMTSLFFNNFVQTRHENLPMLIIIGIAVTAIFTFVFVLYANSFLVKKRNKEFALYGILGLEKKQISKILRIEQYINFLIIGAFGIISGHLIGKILFLTLNLIMNDKQAGLMDYPFEPKAAIISLVLLTFILIVTYISNSFKVKLSNPIKLLGKQRAVQKEPKSNWLLMLIGFLSLFGGYYIALTTKGLIDALSLFFLAVVLVAIGTYLLFVSFTIILLKWIKNKKQYFYKANNFLSISGMLYRMKSNGIGLASIAILSTGIIITLGTTMTIYKGIDNVVETTVKTDYELTDNTAYSPNKAKEVYQEAKDDLRKTVKNTKEDNLTIQRLNVSGNIFVPVVKKEDELIIATKENVEESSSAFYMTATTIDDYNEGKKDILKLAKNEIYMTANLDKLKNTDQLELANKKYSVKELNDNVAGNIAIGSYLVVVPNHETLLDLANYYQVLDINTNTLLPADIRLTASWDVSKNSGEYMMRLENNIKDSNYRLITQKDIEKDIYSLNGGFLFLGVVVGTLFLIGTVLITYYKQVSEGYEDRMNYQIMKKVGLRDELISKAARKQIVWMFFLPLMVASIHTLVASKILYNLLGVFGIHKLTPFITSMGLVIGVFAIVYFIVFRITSRIYYKIVN